jgi:NTE family protein
MEKEKAIEILQNKTAFAFEGGGTLGVSHVSALEKLHQLGGMKKITHVVGSSVGSIVGTALAAGATIEYMKDTLFNMDLKIFQDIDSNNKLKDLFQLLKYYGQNKTEAIRTFIGQVLKDLTGNSDITFKQLHESTNIHLTITYLSLYYDKTLYADYLTEPDTMVKDAVTKSSTIPIFYEAYWEDMLDQQYQRKCFSCKCFSFNREMYKCSVDGGTLDNYPIHVLREQGCDPINIIGFKFISDGELNVYDYSYNNQVKIAKGSPKNIVQFLIKIAEIGRIQAMHVHVDENDWKLTVKTHVGELTSTDFNMTEEQKLWLYNQGTKAVEKHLEDIKSILESNDTFN